MKPMLPSLSFQVPTGQDWVYEVKYDGFRALLKMDNQNIVMISRNGKDLLPQFPEAIQFYNQEKAKLAQYFPIIFDGELTILENPSKSDFSLMQTRGRLRSEKRINEMKESNYATFLAFDLLMVKGQFITDQPFYKRKESLVKLMENSYLPLHPDPYNKVFIQFIPYRKKFHRVWDQVVQNDGEGIIAKQINSQWMEGKRTTQWIKYKNWKKVQCFVTAFEKKNSFFHVAVYDQTNIVPIGLFKNGMNQEETSALLSVMRKNALEENDQLIYVAPSICLELYYLQFSEHSLREPFFSRFLFHVSPTECTLNKIYENKQERQIEITHPDKLLWKNNPITKLTYINYLQDVYPYMAPYLQNRLLTVIRYPYGIFGEAFFQKNCPLYAPNFVDTYINDGINYILCNNINTFLWLGNQLAIEFHIPFQTINKTNPTEIVIDLDPPTKREFPLAQEAARYIKRDIIDKLGLRAFVKVSGNRGIQIYFPLNENRITWGEARLFTEFIARYLLAKNENHFTIERLKKKRGNRLYIDYIQHAEGKTIICPFSVRGNANAGVAAPIEWDELNKSITPDGFSMEIVLKRLKEKGNPFSDYFQVMNEDPLQEIIQILKKKPHI